MNSKMNSKTKKLVLAAMMLALCLVLPFLTGQIRELGNKLLPMHLPVFLCGLLCGAPWGLLVGFAAPLLRSVLFGMPVLYPTAISMAIELATYGAVAGFLYNRSRWQCVVALYRSLLAAMIAGRCVWGVVQAVLLGLTGSALTMQAFVTAALLNAVPGLILQLTLIPALMVALHRTGLVRFRHDGAACREQA